MSKQFFCTFNGTKGVKIRIRNSILLKQFEEVRMCKRTNLDCVLRSHYVTLIQLLPV